METFVDREWRDLIERVQREREREENIFQTTGIGFSEISIVSSRGGRMINLTGMKYILSV